MDETEIQIFLLKIRELTLSAMYAEEKKLYNLQREYHKEILQRCEAFRNQVSEIALDLMLENA